MADESMGSGLGLYVMSLFVGLRKAFYHSNGRPKYVSAHRASRYTLMSDWIPETVRTQPVARRVYSSLQPGNPDT